MPFILACAGEQVLVDDEDYQFANQWRWHVYRIRPSMKPAAARSAKRYNRMWRAQLHREIAIRRDPKIAKRKFRVYPRNGDYLDCRRENLEVAVQKLKAGHPYAEIRSAGWEREPLQRITRRQDLLPVGETWTGGLVYRRFDQRKSGGRAILRYCAGNTPVD